MSNSCGPTGWIGTTGFTVGYIWAAGLLATAVVSIPPAKEIMLLLLSPQSYSVSTASTLQVNATNFSCHQ